ncbi:MAG: histidinol-phosphate transaminase [Candidatus Limnocylindrales bacterium]
MSLETTEALVASSNVYTWEPPNRVIAARYGLDPADILRFDTNTSPAVLSYLPDALEGPWDPPLHEYPDSTYAELAEAAAAYVGAEPLEILVGCGADEVLDIIAKTHLAPGQRSVIPVPTYSMYAVLSGQREAEVVSVPRRPDHRLDVEAVITALPGAGVVWLCAPNNPTGTPESREDLLSILDAAAALPDGGPAVVVDEAYIEFHGTSLVDLRERYRALIVVRTMSKAFAMTGLRVGYCVASRAAIERLERVRPPGSLNTLSAKAAARALRAPEVAAANAAALAEEREWLAARLAEAGLPPTPSVTNFLLCHIGSPAEADGLNEALLRGGIVVRTFGPRSPLAGHLRFTVRNREQNERFLSIIEAWSAGRSA